MDEECEVEEIFAQVSSIDLDPGQVNLLLSSLNPVSQKENDDVQVIDNPENSDYFSQNIGSGVETCWQNANSVESSNNNNIVLTVSPLFRPTPPPLSSDFRVHHCSKCDFFSLSSDVCAKHENLDHPAPRPTIQCISCPNIFLSLQALKVHLLLDHEVLKDELQSILLLTLKKCEEFLLSSNPVVGNEKKSNGYDGRNSVDFCSTELSEISDPKPISPGNHNLDINPSPSFTYTNIHPTDDIPSPYQDISDKDDDDETGRKTSLTSISELQTSSFSGDNLKPESELDSGMQQISLPFSPKHISGSSSKGDSESSNLSGDDEEDEYSDCSDDESDDGFCNGTIEGNDESITKQLQLMEHLKKEKLKANRCQLDNCRLRFKSFNTLDYHKKCHNQKSWKCPECSKVLTTWHSLSLHLWNDHTIDMELYYCNFCSFRTPNLSHLRTSHIWIHGKGKLFTCSICNKGFKTKKQLRNHQVIHKKSVVRFECEQCKALFSKCHLLRQHYDAVHQRTRRYRCNTCGHRSASKSAHALHIRTHTKERKYSCGECSYWTGDHNALRRHVATHSGARPYSCPHCTYVSISSTSLLSHVNSKHPGMLGDVMFSCPLCPFKTLRKEIFVAHASKHNFNSPSGHKQIQLGMNLPDTPTVSK